MATILKANNRDFKEEPNKIDKFRLFSDISRKKQGIDPKNLNFDLRLLNSGEYSAPYHFHRFAEELFFVLSGSMMLRSENGVEKVSAGDIIFCEMGEKGAHQFFNDQPEPCTYLDIRTFVGFDICEYPDSEKILIAPSFEILAKNAMLDYFDGEKNIDEKWNRIKGQDQTQ